MIAYHQLRYLGSITGTNWAANDTNFTKIVALGARHWPEVDHKTEHALASATHLNWYKKLIRLIRAIRGNE